MAHFSDSDVSVLDNYCIGISLCLPKWLNKEIFYLFERAEFCHLQPPSLPTISSGSAALSKAGAVVSNCLQCSLY